MYELIKENLSGLGGPMGSEHTSIDWKKHFETAEDAMEYAENDSTDFLGNANEVTWRSRDRYKTVLSSQDLLSHMYHIQEIEVEPPSRTARQGKRKE